MAEAKVAINRPSSANTPPNCAICLGGCSNKCFSDSCMHQFCFNCLLEWSKIKAECPLCKQPFKSIIHNIKSNVEYDEHIVEAPRNDDVRLINEEFMFLPVALTPHRQFHVQTTFTVDSRGEHAIQQMLLTHPLTAGGRITVGANFPSSRTIFPSRRRDFSATSFRRSIYAQNLWVNAVPDLSGRYRECSPNFFRNNPGARQRLVPWLNRELNALLYENTQLVMHLVDLIMDHLLRHHICSRTFRNMLREYLDAKTDHFVHEFYSFMRSPFDMIGYDRNVIYTSRPQSPAPFLEDEDVFLIPDENSDDSDVQLVSVTTPAEPPTINLADSSSESDEPVMVPLHGNSQLPMPIVPSPLPEALPTPSFSPSTSTVNLPPKLRHKHKSIQEKYKSSWAKKKRKHRSNNSSSYSSDDSSEKETYRSYKQRKKLKKLKRKLSRHIDTSDSSSSTEVNITSSDSDSEVNVPVSNIIKQKRKKSKKSKKEKKRKHSHSHHEALFRVREQPKSENPRQIFPMDLSIETPARSSYSGCPVDLSIDTPSCSRYPNTSKYIQTSPESTISRDAFSMPSQPSTSRYHVELPTSSRSKVELCDNGQYTSVEIKTSLGDNNDEPSSSRTKIKIVRNEPSSPEYSRQYSEHHYPESGSSNERKYDPRYSDSGSSTESYAVPTVKSEIREVKLENSEPSSSKPLPLVLRRKEHNKWYVLDDGDSSD